MNYNIVIRLRDLVTQNLNRVRRDLNRLSDVTINANVRLRGMETLNRLRDRTLNIQARLRGVADIENALDGIKRKAIALSGVLASLVIPLKQSMDFELQFIDVDKVFNGTKKELDNIKKTIFDIAKQSSASVKDITAITAKGIGTGKIPLQDMRDFIQLANQSKVAFSLSTDKVGGAMDTVLSKLGYDVATMRKLFDMLNYSTNISSAKMGDMLNILKRTGGAMKQLKTNEIATLINFSTEKGVSPETTASSLNTIINRLKALDKVKLKKLNLDMGGLSGAKAFKEGKGYDYLFKVLTKLSKIKDADKQYKMITGIFGTGEQKNLIENFLNDMQGLSKRFSKISLKTNWQDSVKNEFEKVEATSIKKLERLKGLFNILMISIGTNMLGAFNKLLNFISPVVNKIVEFAQKNKALVKTILKIIAVIALVVSGLLIFKAVMLSMVLVSSVVMGAISSLISGIIAVLGVVSLPIVAIGALIAGLIIYWDDFKSGVTNAIGTENLELIKNLFSTIVTILSNMWDIVTTVFNTLSEKLFGTTTKLDETTQSVSVLGAIFNTLGVVIGTAMKGAIAVIKVVYNHLSSMYRQIKAIIGAVSNIKMPKSVTKITSKVKHEVKNAWSATKDFLGFGDKKKQSSNKWNPKPLTATPGEHSTIDINFKGSGVRELKVSKVRATNINVSNRVVD